MASGCSTRVPGELGSRSRPALPGGEPCSSSSRQTWPLCSERAFSPSRCARPQACLTSAVPVDRDPRPEGGPASGNSDVKCGTVPDDPLRWSARPGKRLPKPVRSSTREKPLSPHSASGPRPRLPMTITQGPIPTSYLTWVPWHSAIFSPFLPHLSK